MVFAGIVTRYIDGYIASVLQLTTRSEAAKNLVLPLTDRFGMALVVTTAMGLIYGLVVGVGVLLVPMLAPVVVFPYLDGSLLVGFVLFGLILGGSYGELVMGWACRVPAPVGDHAGRAAVAVRLRPPIRRGARLPTGPSIHRRRSFKMGNLFDS